MITLIKLTPIWVFFFLGLFLFRGLGRRSRIEPDGRLYWIFSIIITGASIAIVMEILGALHLLGHGPMLAAWCLIDLFFLGWLFFAFRNDFTVETLKSVWAGARKTWQDICPPARIIIVLSVIFAAFVGAIAWHAPTTAWDSHTYHMARIMHWQQNRSLAHYATHILRQVEMAPGGEFATATLLFLADSDGPVNLAEWMAWITAALAASYVTTKLLAWNSARTGQEWSREKIQIAGSVAVLLVLTLPQAVTQAISTETDVMVAMWNLALVVLGLLIVREPRNLFYIGGFALVLGLGILTKATIFLSAPAFIAAVVVILGLRKQYREIAYLAGAAAVACTILNAPWMMRNHHMFGHFLSSSDKVNEVVCAKFTPSLMAGNVVRNISLYTRNPSENLTSGLNNVLYATHTLLGRLQNTNTTYASQPFYFQPVSSFQAGDGFGNPQAWLLVLAIGLFCFGYCSSAFFAGYLALVALGFAFFCGYLRWQPWHFRLHITYFFLIAPFMAVVLVQVTQKWFLPLITGLMLVNGFLCLIYNFSYPLCTEAMLQEKPREEQYFGRRLDRASAYLEVANDIIERHCTNVLLKIGSDTWEYPLWVCLKERGFKGRIQHSLVDNVTQPREIVQTGPQTVLAQIDAALPAEVLSIIKERLPLEIDYDGNVKAFYSSNRKETRMKMLSNHLQLVYEPPLPKPAGTERHVRVHAKIVDMHEVPVTNNVMSVLFEGKESQAPLSAGVFDFGIDFNTEKATLQLQLKNSEPTERGTISLSDLTYVESPNK